MKTKIKSYGDETTWSFHDKEIPKMGSNHACLAVIRVQIHWEREKVIRHITDDLESHSDDSDEE